MEKETNLHESQDFLEGPYLLNITRSDPENLIAVGEKNNTTLVTIRNTKKKSYGNLS